MGIDEKRDILASVAKKFAGWRYEVDELINEAWLKERIREAQHPAEVFMCGRTAMIDYMRKQEKYRVGRKRRVWFHPLVLEHDDTGDRYNKEPETVCFDNVAFRDDLERRCRGFTREQKLVLTARLDGIPHRQIAKVIGVCESRVSQIWANLRAIMRIQYEISKAEMVA